MYAPGKGTMIAVCLRRWVIPARSESHLYTRMVAVVTVELRKRVKINKIQ